MFSKSLDSKKEYTNADGSTLIDLTSSIFNKNVSMSSIGTVLKVTKDYEMRPDLVSKALYGTDDYTEMILKYSLISNPFSIESGDIVYNISMSYIYNPVVDLEEEETESYNFVKNYHKYIDKSKVPSTAGSEVDETEITSNTATEPNISKTGNSGIVVKNGKVYFGASSDDSVDSSLVDCAKSGVTLGEFLTATVTNYDN